MADEDETPNFRKARPSSRGDRMLDSARRRAGPQAYPVVDPFADNESTGVLDFDALSDDEPLTGNDGRRLLRHLKRQMIKADESAQRAVTDAVDAMRELVKHPPNEAVMSLQRDFGALSETVDVLVQSSEATEKRLDGIKDTLAAHDRDIDPVRSVKKWIFGSASAAIIAVVVFAWSTSASVALAKAQMEQVVRDAAKAEARADKADREREELRQEMRAIRRASNKGQEP